MPNKGRKVVYKRTQKQARHLKKLKAHAWNTFKHREAGQYKASMGILSPVVARYRDDGTYRSRRTMLDGAGRDKKHSYYLRSTEGERGS